MTASAVKTNDTLDLKPRTTFGGPALEFDFPELHIGVGEYDEGPTGCTVFYLPGGGFGVVDVGSIEVGTLNTDYLRMTGGPLHAVCLAAGSLYGMEAVTGVAAELFARAGYTRVHGATPLVAGAITHDYDHRESSVYPDKALGRAALRAAQPGRFPLGQRGVARSVSVGKGLSLDHAEPSGQGGAFRQAGQTKIAFFTSVNALGAIVNRQGQVVRGNRDPQTGRRYHLHEAIGRRAASPANPPGPGRNTTLSVLVTNERLDYPGLRQLAREVHTSMGRGIRPFQTRFDGDVLFAVTTNQVENAALQSAAGQGAYNDLGVVAAEVAWDAILACFAPDQAE